MFAGELRKQKMLFAAADGVALFGAFVGAISLHDPSGAMQTRLLEADPTLLCLAVLAVAGLWILVFRAFDLYRMRSGGARESLAIVKACSVAALLTLLGGFLAHIEVSRIAVMLGWALSMPLVVIVRSVVRGCIRRLYTNSKIAIPLVVVGFNPVAHYLFDQVLDQMTQYEAVGFLDDGAPGRQYRGYPVLGGPEGLERLGRIYPNLEAAIALPDRPQEEQARIVWLCEEHRVRWWIVPWMLRSLGAGLKVDMLGTVPLVGPRGSNIEGLNFAIKRSFDIVAGSILLVLAAPAIALAAAAVWLVEGRPVFFRQTRVGIHGQPFEILKLRTMTADASDTVHREYTRCWIRNGDAAARDIDEPDGAVFKLAEDHRVTATGKILRRFSIDELPQLINVVRGEMSLIGPRPALPYELDHYGTWHRRRLDAVPGITGLWQTSGRNRLSFDDMVRLDVQYIENWSLGSDLKILFRTVPVLLRGEGV